MTIYSLLFYTLAAVIVASTAVAITRRNMVHAVVYLVVSFFGSAMLFYLFGAFLLAVLEVIIYAGAIMILFLFIIMMLRVESDQQRRFSLKQWLPAVGFGIVYIIAGGIMVLADTESRVSLTPAHVDPAVFGHELFRRHWLSIEIVSLLLLVALVGALYLGLRPGSEAENDHEEPS
jgi:NADH-quinone oxidoreductase subunit J